MNRIVREHYPVERLPEDLRAGWSVGQTVTITVEEDRPQLQDINAQIDEILRNPTPMTFAEARRHAGARTTSSEEAVARVRALRDEWDD